MNQIQDEVRELPPHLDVPESMKGRVRRRIALNALAAGLMIAIIAGGAVVGLRAIGATNDQPADGGGSRTRVPITSPTSTDPCTSGQLRATGSMEGAAGSRDGAVQLTNLSDATCTLTGTPTVTVLDPNQQPISTGVTFGSTPPGWDANARPTPAGWPVVTLAPGDIASVRVSWSNWCPQGRAAPLWQLTIPGSGSVDVTGFDALDPPPCNGAGLGSTIDVGPFEPNLGA
jgi:hypothetical protein